MKSIQQYNPDYMISAGTQVVLQVTKPIQGQADFKKQGCVGIVLQCPPNNDLPYLIRFTDGSIVEAHNHELTLRRQEIDHQLEINEQDWSQYIVYRCKVGSKAYGLSHEESDDDVRGIFIPPANLHWSLYKVPEQLEFLEGSQDEVFWEIEKFVKLALKANPTFLEVLWTPIVLEESETSIALRSIRDAFLSKHLYKTYSGYVLSQFRRMTNAYKNSGTFKVKHAMHLIRLLLSGIHALKTGEVLVDVSEHREELLAIRAGERTFQQIRERAFQLEAEFLNAFEQTNLPDQPDFTTIDNFLINARTQAATTYLNNQKSD
ncbi:MAG: nucleotidyltransferase [Blastopirellula sp.]|nr:MAG: nucleotidyltransferase [Blastopirellula sp.]